MAPARHAPVRNAIERWRTRTDPVARCFVEADADERDRFGAWLEDEGFELLVCVGPTEPDYTCIGARTGACPSRPKRRS